MDGYDVTKAADAFAQFLDELTNWYIRRSRRRFWKSENDGDKAEAYATLYEVLTTVNRMLAPFIPFTSEVVYQNLERGYDSSVSDSVHLSEWPKAFPYRRDLALENSMQLVRQVVTLAHSIRADNKVRVRQPLKELVVPGMLDSFLEYTDIILDELNIKSLRRIDDPAEIMTWRAKADFKSLGPKFGSRAKDIAIAISSLDHDILKRFAGGSSIEVAGENLGKDDIVLSLEPKPGYWIRADGGVSVGVSNLIDENLTSEWLAREFVHHVQNLRKEADLQVSDRIALDYSGAPEISAAIEANKVYVSGEILASRVSLSTSPIDGSDARIGDYSCRVRIELVK
jgi:isoleucyl-tRNA synthetase